jgi:hypothetical protein
MKATKIILIVMVMFCTVLYAQTESEPETILTEALQFRYSNFSFGSFDGSTISYKKMLSPEKETRYSLTLNASSTNESYQYDTENQYIILDTTTLLYETDEKFDKRFDFLLAYSRLTHKRHIEKVSLYYGGGPLMGFNFKKNGKDEETASDTTLSLENTSISNSTLSLGLQGVVGWEWRVNNFLGITAEYSSTLKWSVLKSSSTKTETFPEDREYNFIFDSKLPTYELYGSTRVGVSLYF